MVDTQKGIAISSQHGKVDIAFTDILRQTNDENDSYITTIWYTASGIEQTFSKAEVKQLYAYFKQRGNVRLKGSRASPPSNGSIGFGAYPVGGGNDFYMFSEEPGYSLPFKVWGYFDLRHRD